MNTQEIQESAAKTVVTVDSVQERKTKKTNAKSVWVGVGFAVGILSIAAGLLFIFGFKDEAMIGYVTELGAGTYGADFYTEVAESIAFAGNAVKAVYEMMSRCFGILFVIIGSIDICYFGSKMENCEKSAASTEGSKIEREIEREGEC